VSLREHTIKAHASRIDGQCHDQALSKQRIAKEIDTRLTMLERRNVEPAVGMTLAELKKCKKEALFQWLQANTTVPSSVNARTSKPLLLAHVWCALQALVQERAAGDQ